MRKHVAVTTQSQHPWRATIRTILAVVIALAALAPALYTAATMQSPELATGAAAAVLTIAAAITRIMALPVVEAFLQRFVPWLAAGIPRSHEIARETTESSPTQVHVVSNLDDISESGTYRVD